LRYLATIPDVSVPLQAAHMGVMDRPMKPHDGTMHDRRMTVHCLLALTGKYLKEPSSAEFPNAMMPVRMSRDSGVAEIDKKWKSSDSLAES
jgi:hypothetical protein